MEIEETQNKDQYQKEKYFKKSYENIIEETFCAKVVKDTMISDNADLLL